MTLLVPIVVSARAHGHGHVLPQDGVTYQNDCLAECQAVKVQSSGPCGLQGQLLSRDGKLQTHSTTQLVLCAYITARRAVCVHSITDKARAVLCLATLLLPGTQWHSSFLLPNLFLLSLFRAHASTCTISITICRKWPD